MACAGFATAVSEFLGPESGGFGDRIQVHGAQASVARVSSLKPKPAWNTLNCSAIVRVSHRGMCPASATVPGALFVQLICCSRCICCYCYCFTTRDTTSSTLLPDSSYSCCIHNLHALVHKRCQPVNDIMMTTHKILQRCKWQLCKSALSPNHSGRCARKGFMDFVIYRKIVHSQSCTSLATTRKPYHSLMHAKFHPQAMATEAKPSHAQHRPMFYAQFSSQLWMWSRLFTQRRGAKALHGSTLQCSTHMYELLELLPATPSPMQNGLSCHVQVRWVHMSTCSQRSTPIHLRTRLAVHTKL
jgi:hypothetical protein